MIFKIVNKFIFNNNYIKFNNNLKITLYLERDNSILPSRNTQECNQSTQLLVLKNQNQYRVTGYVITGQFPLVTNYLDQVTSFLKFCYFGLILGI
jgi:hypothetical protein